MGSNNRRKVLRQAESLVNGDRDEQYGDPVTDFQATADMWSAYLGRRLGAPIKLEPHDVAAMMMCLKIARIAHAPEKADNWVDVAGYSACGWDCLTEEPGTVGSYPVRRGQYDKHEVVKRPNKGYYWGYEAHGTNGWPPKGEMVEGG